MLTLLEYFHCWIYILDFLLFYDESLCCPRTGVFGLCCSLMQMRILVEPQWKLCGNFCFLSSCHLGWKFVLRLHTLSALRETIVSCMWVKRPTWDVSKLWQSHLLSKVRAFMWLLWTVSVRLVVSHGCNKCNLCWKNFKLVCVCVKTTQNFPVMQSIVRKQQRWVCCKTKLCG